MNIDLSAKRLHISLRFLSFFTNNVKVNVESTAEVGPGEVKTLKSGSYYVGTHLCPQLTIREASDKAGPLHQMNRPEE